MNPELSDSRERERVGLARPLGSQLWSASHPFSPSLQGLDSLGHLGQVSPKEEGRTTVEQVMLEGSVGTRLLEGVWEKERRLQRGCLFPPR